MNTNRIVITLSDPWELGETLQWRPIYGALTRQRITTHGNRVLIKLDGELEHNGVSYLFVVAAPRYEGERMEALDVGRSISCSFTGISRARAESDNPLDLKWWRGGLYFMGDLAYASE